METLNLDQYINSAAKSIATALNIGEVSAGYTLDVDSESQFVVRTDIVQRLAANAQVSEKEIASKSLEILANSKCHADSKLRWLTSDRFLNLVSAAPLSNPASSFSCDLALPHKVYALKPPSSECGSHRLIARVAVQRMALTILNQRHELVMAPFEEMEKLVNLELISERGLSTFWIYPNSAPKDRLALVLRKLGSKQRVSVESITSDEWGNFDYQISEPLTLGQVIALAEYNLTSETDLAGAGRNEVQNLPWLLKTLVQRLDSIFGSMTMVDAEVTVTDNSLFAEPIKNVAWREVALRGAAAGRVAAYIGFWRSIAQSILRIINDPAVRQRAAKGAVDPADQACYRLLMSVLSETVATWENNLQRELILT